MKLIVRIHGIYFSASDSNVVIHDSHITTNGSAINISKPNNCEIIKSTINVTGNNTIIQCGKGNVYLTITDSTLNNEESTNKSNGISINGGILNIKGKTNIKSSGASIYSGEDSNTTVNIESGTIESINSQAIIMNKATGDINIGIKDEEVNTDSPILKSALSEWTVRSDMMNLNFYDGKLIGGKYKIIGASIVELEDGYNLVSDKYTDDKGTEFDEIKLGKSEGEAELKNGSETEKTYPTLKDAIEAASTENPEQQTTIKLLKDVYQAHQIKIKKGQNIKIDLNGHKFFALIDEALYNEGTLEIVDNTKMNSEIESEADDDYNLIGSTGAVIIHNVAAKNDDETSSKGKLTLGKGTKVNYTASGVSTQYKKVIRNDGELKTDGATITVSGNYIYVIDNIGTIDLNGGKITTSGTNTYVVYSDGTNTNETEKSKISGVNISQTGSNSYGVYNNNNEIIEIKGKTNIESKGTAIYNHVTGKIVIDDVTITCSGAANAIDNEGQGTIDINSGKIESKATSNSYFCIRNYNGGTINIKDGEIIGINVVIYNYNNKDSGTINIEGGTIRSSKDNCIQNGYKNPGTVNIIGGTIISEKKYGIYNKAGTLKLGEKIKDEDVGEVNTVNPSITGETYGVYNEGTFNFYDGAITGPIGKSIYGGISDNEDGYQRIITKNADGTTETSTLQEVEVFELNEINGTQTEESMGRFATIAKLQEKLNTLTGESKNYKIKVLANFSIRLSEKIEIPKGLTVTIDLNGFSVTTANSPAIENNGELTIMDSSQELSGNIISELNGKKDSYVGNVYNGENAKLNIVSGNITSRGLYEYGVYNCETGTVSISGGTINVEGSNGHGVYNEGILDLTKNTIRATSSNSYAVYNNSSSEKKVTIKASTIESTKGNGIYNENSGTIEIGDIVGSEEKDIITTINTLEKAVDNHGEGKIIIDGADITSTSSNSIYNYSTGTIEIKKGNLSSSSSYNTSFGIYNYSGGTVNMTGGNITSKVAGIYNNNYYEHGTINIEGGTITSSSSYAINNNKSNDSGTVYITGGTMVSNSTYAIYNYGGTLTIGKKIEHTETSEDVPSKDNPSITGKTYGVYNNDTFNYYAGAISGNIGQSINANITEIQKDYQVVKKVENNIETATLEKIDIMEIDNQNYKTITEIQNKISSFNGTEEHKIKLLNDMYMCKSETITIPQNANVQIDLNGHLIETTSDVAITNNGKLEIKDSSTQQTGKIWGTAETFIDNKNELIINGGEYQAINYVSLINNSDIIKVINNNSKLEWNSGKLTITIGNSYGIYNTGEGSINWKAGDMSLTASDTKNRQYGIYVDGTGNIDIETINLNIRGYTASQAYSNQYFIYSKDNKDKKVKVDIKGLEVEGNTNGNRYGIYGSNLNLNISGGHFKTLNSDINLNDSEIHITGGTFDDSITIPNGTTTTIDGNDTSIDYITNRGTLNIENGKIKHITCSSDESNVTMNNGSIYNSEDNALEISSGTFTLKGGTIESTKKNGVNISGNTGTFTMGENDGSVSTIEPKVKGLIYGIYCKSGKFNFYDGVVEGNTKAIYGEVYDTPQNHKVKIEEEETVATLGTISDTENVVSVGHMYYNNIESAVEQANRVSGTILLYKDLKVESPLTIEETAEVILNLNGHNLTAENKDILITNNGKLTIIDESPNNDSASSSIESKIENKSGYAISNNGTLTIGTKDSKINEITPHIKGNPNAIQNNGKVYWYDGKINEQTTSQEGEMTLEISNIKKKIESSAENILQELQKTLKAVVQNPIIKVDKEFPIWTNESVTATIYTPSRIVLDIVNNNENTELQSIVAKKVWKMPEEEAENYRVTIQLMKKKDEEIVPALDKQEKEITVRIIGNGTQTFDNVPIYEGENKIEYVLKEIKVEKRTSRDDEDWQELPLNEFSVTYEDE